MEIEEKAAAFRKEFDDLREEVSKVIVGCDSVIEGVLTCLFANGHCLLEGVPGLGKTMLVKTLSDALASPFSRIQFTPDLMPADILGTNMVLEDDSGKREMRFRPGPIFSNILLADEINRATPKTQSALLEAMQEHTVTVANETHVLDEPFFVLATQNPIEMDGTYPLPEAQVDRFFFKLLVEPPTHDVLVEILNRTTQKESPSASKIIDGSKINEWREFVREVVVAPKVMDYGVSLIRATQPTSDMGIEKVNSYVRYGSSPRGAQALLLAGKVSALRAGRYNVSFGDLRDAAYPALRHRVLLNFEAEADNVTSDDVIAAILESVETPTQ